MKTLFILLAIIFCTVSAGADEVKYQVTIDVVYNEVSLEEANKIIADAMERHQSACKVKVEAKKVNEGYLTIYDGGDWLIQDTEDVLEFNSGSFTTDIISIPPDDQVN